MAKKKTSRATAESMAKTQREISVSEFFAKNRHLLGFDNPRKALLTTVKEAVDNALDACEEADILPDILVEIRHLPDVSEDRFVAVIQDNGPGIVRKQVEHIFGKLLYGSKFHRLKMSRGQQGIGISAAGMYGLMTTGKPVRIVTKTGPRKSAHEVVLKMDTSKNKADIVSDKEIGDANDLFDKADNGTGTGTRVEVELQGKYFTGARSVDEYVQLTAVANPHARFTYVTPPTSAKPEGDTVTYERTVDELPDLPEEIKPHPHGIELGTLISMLERTEHTQLGGFLEKEFCRLGPKIRQQVAEGAGLTTRTWTSKVTHDQAEKLFKALGAAKVMGPPTNCLSPIGVRTLLKGLQQGMTPDFIAASSRPPAVYRGRPFVIEAGIAFGGDLPSDDSAKVYRFANRVPLQYQQSACSSFKAVIETGWKKYNLQQPRGGVPVGPIVFMVHMASVWVPFTSESKEAIADYDEIRKEMKLALQDCGRKLGAYLRRRQKMKREGERRGVFKRYIGEIAKACESLNGTDAGELYTALLATAEEKTARFDDVLDDAGKVVDPHARLSKDEGVFIREEPAPPLAPTGSDIDLDRAAADKDSELREKSGSANLFGESEPVSTPKKKRVKKKVKKKVRKARSNA
ncbi:MAG: DNA topoisomerase VI subunit B [Planctomycetota bacterium]